MASALKHLPFFFLLLLLSSVQIEARVNKFFSKFIHTDRNDASPLTPALPVAPSPAPLSAPPEISPILAPTPFFYESQNAYGLYGRASDDTENNPSITDVEEEILAEDGGDESYKSGYPKTSFHGTDFESSRRDEQYQSSYGNNGYGNSEYENNGGRNYQYESNFEDGGFRRSRYEPRERQGMSDTRFVENGKYYYDANSRAGEEGESYGSKKNPIPNQFEFDSMEEYEKSEEFHRP